MATRLIRYLGSRATISVGAAFSIIAYLVLATIGTSTAALAVSSILLGIGGGLLLASVATLVNESVEPGALGIANALTTLFRTLGSSVSSAITAALSVVSPVLGPSVMAAVVLVVSVLLVWADACGGGRTFRRTSDRAPAG